MLKSEMKAKGNCGRHKKKDLTRDMNSALDILLERAKVFDNEAGRMHQSIGPLPATVFAEVDVDKVHAYLIEKKKYFSDHRAAY